MSLTQFGEKLELRSEVEIRVEPARLWRVLLDFPNHGRWNPFWANVRGNAALGSRVELDLTPPGGNDLRLRRIVRIFELDRQLGWSGGYGWGWRLRSDQFFRLTALHEQGTRLTVAENLRGPGVTNNSQATLNIARGQALMNQALKRYVESASDRH
jgi:hypothetical protein